MKDLSMTSQNDRKKKEHLKEWNYEFLYQKRGARFGVLRNSRNSRNELVKEMNPADLALDTGKILRRAKSIFLLHILAMLKPWEVDRLLRMIEEEMGYARQHVFLLNLLCPSFYRGRISCSSAVILAIWHGAHLFFPGQPWTSPDIICSTATGALPSPRLWTALCLCRSKMCKILSKILAISKGSLTIALLFIYFLIEWPGSLTGKESREIVGGCLYKWDWDAEPQN